MLVSSWVGSSWDSPSKITLKGQIVYMNLYDDGSIEIQNYSYGDKVTSVSKGTYTLVGTNFVGNMSATVENVTYSGTFNATMTSTSAYGTYTISAQGNPVWDSGYWEVTAQ